MAEKMIEKITQEQLNTMTTSDKDALILTMQKDLANVRDALKLTKSMYDNLYEQICAMRANRFAGRNAHEGNIVRISCRSMR